MMDWMKKERLCRGAYWTIFIIAPTAVVTFVGSWSHPRIGWTLPVFFVLVLIGEHAYRRWVKLWRMDRWPDEPKAEMKESPNKQIHPIAGKPGSG